MRESSLTLSDDLQALLQGAAIIDPQSTRPGPA